MMVQQVQAGLPSRYRVIEEVGQGGMAIVYRAQDETLCREVAVKVLHPHLCSEPESKARLQREAQAVAKLRHDNILQIFDYSGQDSPASFIVTEFIDGLTLKQFFATRKPPMPEVAALIMVGVARALCHAHAAGIIHRDIKPENVMVRRDGVLKLMDFGVAQVIDLERMTVTGQLLGSPAYMAPEIFEGKPLDFRTDVFSMGVLLYQLATGALPFTGRNPHEVLKRIAEGRFTDPRTVNRLISDRLSRIIGRALAKRPDDRYPTIAALLDDLSAFAMDAGLDDADAEIKGYFTDPEGHSKALGARVVAGLVATGRREQAAGRLARALESWNRALAIDPANPDVARALKRLEGRRRLRHGAIALGGTALMGGLIWGAFKLAHNDVPAPIAQAIGGAPKVVSPPKPAPPRAPEESVAKVEKVRRRALQGRTPAPKTADMEVAPPAPPSVPARTLTGAPPTRTFDITAKPARMTIFVDGISQGEYGPKNQQVTLSWDRNHKVEFRNDGCCQPLTFDVGPDRPMLPGDRFPAVLNPKVGKLTVTLSQELKDAKIGVLGPGVRLSTTAGEQVVIPFDAGGELRKILEVSVLTGSTVVKREVEILAGQTLNFPVQLD